MADVNYSDPTLQAAQGAASPVDPNQVFYPVRSISPTANAWAAESQAFGPQPGSKFFDPYGVNAGQDRYKSFPIYGGTRDLLKSIATRRIAINDIMQQLNQPATPMGLQEGLQQSSLQLGGGDKLSNEAFTNLSPGLNTPFQLEKDKYNLQLRDLLNSAYVLGGGLYGGAYSAWAAAKKLSKAKDAQKTAQLQAIVGGAMKGLGLNQYGEADTTSGFIGGLEL